MPVSSVVVKVYVKIDWVMHANNLNSPLLYWVLRRFQLEPGRSDNHAHVTLIQRVVGLKTFMLGGELKEVDRGCEKSLIIISPIQRR